MTIKTTILFYKNIMFYQTYCVYNININILFLLIKYPYNKNLTIAGIFEF